MCISYGCQTVETLLNDKALDACKALMEQKGGTPKYCLPVAMMSHLFNTNLRAMGGSQSQQVLGGAMAAVMLAQGAMLISTIKSDPSRISAIAPMLAPAKKLYCVLTKRSVCELASKALSIQGFIGSLKSERLKTLIRELQKGDWGSSDLEKSPIGAIFAASGMSQGEFRKPFIALSALANSSDPIALYHTDPVTSPNPRPTEAMTFALLPRPVVLRTGLMWMYWRRFLGSWMRSPRTVWQQS